MEKQKAFVIQNAFWGGSNEGRIPVLSVPASGLGLLRMDPSLLEINAMLFITITDQLKWCQN